MKAPSSAFWVCTYTQTRACLISSIHLQRFRQFSAVKPVSGHVHAAVSPAFFLINELTLAECDRVNNNNKVLAVSLSII